MSAKIAFLATVLTVANAGFLGTPTVVVPGYGSRSTTVYHGSSLAYRPPLSHRAPQTYNVQFAATASPPGRSEDTVAREDTPSQASSSSTKDSEGNTNFNSNAAFSYSYNQKDAEAVRANAQREGIENGAVESDGTRRNVEDARLNAIEIKASAATPVTPAPTLAAPAADRFVLVTAPALYHPTPVTYHTPVTYDAQVTYHAPLTKVLSEPVTKFAYSTSQISYGPTPTPTLLEDCLTCPQ